ncbi:MAG: transport system permease protein [Rhodocyclales bacterium]|nr:transport system permease protein [Rhodocyclales bacterium]
MMPVLLISDVLLFVLIALTVTGLVFAARREPIRRAWRNVLSDPIAMAALAVLMVFVTGAILDSLHFRRALPPAAVVAPAATTAPASTMTSAKTYYSVEVESLLDVALGDPRARREKSYSAPFAHTLFERQSVDLGDGRRARQYPRLKYGAAQLKDPEHDKASDIASRAAWGVTAALGCVCVMGLLIGGGIARRHRIPLRVALHRLCEGETVLAWRAFLASSTILLVVLVPLLFLSMHYHVFGTDRVGNDLFHYAFKAMRTALLIGTLTSLVTLPLGIGFGIAAGYIGGWVDDAVQYIYTVISSIPYVLLIAASVLLMQVVIQSHDAWFDTAAARADARLVSLCLIIGAISWTSLCRLMRAEALKLRELDYVQAARAFGVTPLSIMRRHILPNAFHIVLITLVLDFSGLVLAEAVLSYVGVGVDAATISYGSMINSARAELARDPMVWWQIATAFVFMVSLVLAANLFADAVREAFDPRGQGATRRRLRRRPA